MVKSLIVVFSCYSKMRFARQNSQRRFQLCSAMRFILDGPFWMLTNQWQRFSQPQSCLNLEISTDYKKRHFFFCFYKSEYLVSL